MKYVAHHKTFEKPVVSSDLEELKKLMETTIYFSNQSSKPPFPRIVRFNFFGKPSKTYIPRLVVTDTTAGVIWYEQEYARKKGNIITRFFKRIFS